MLHLKRSFSERMVEFVREPPAVPKIPLQSKAHRGYAALGFEVPRAALVKRQGIQSLRDENLLNQLLAINHRENLAAQQAIF
jgi:hypothetical protein